jgi:ribosome maturation factor RimP
METRPMDEEIVELIKVACNEESIIFHKVVRIRSGKSNLIKVTVDTENGITLGQCQNLSRKIDDLFFRKNILAGNYQLEVSSPGVEKPLEFPYEYRRNMGRTLEILHEAGGKQMYSRGELVAYNGAVLRLKGKDGELEIPLNQIKHTHVKLQW